MKGRDLKKWRQLSAALDRGEPLDVGAVSDASGGWRVAMAAGGVAMTFSADSARRLADTFHGDQAKAAGIDWIGDALSFCADVCDAKAAKGATLQ